MFALLLSSCQVDRDEPENLKILMNMDEQYYRMFYGGDMFESKYPDIEITYIRDGDYISQDQNYEANLLKLIDKEKPDIIISFLYANLIEAGILKDLSPYIRKNSFDLDALHPIVIRYLKSTSSDNALYGLAPQFSSSALYYNRSLFLENGVTLPSEGMTWPEVLALAQRIPVQDNNGIELFGYHNGYSDLLAYMNAISGNLKQWDMRANRMTINTKSWNNTLQPLITAIQSGHLPYMPPGSDSQNPEFDGETMFIEGKAAMFVAGPGLIQKLSQAPFEWGILKLPLNSDHSTTASIAVQPIYAMYRHAENENTAWKYIQFMNSDETARARSLSVSDLMSRTIYSKERNGVSLEPFQPTDILPPIPLWQNIKLTPLYYFEHVTPIVNQELDDVIQNKQTLDEALQAIQDQGQAKLNEGLAAVDNGR
jgi:multiple sugar transport system substrate-binding protein